MEIRALSFEAIGTRWSINVTSRISGRAWRLLLADIRARIELFDKTYSRFRSDSLVTKMATQSGSFSLPDDAFRLIDLYQRLYTATGGKMTPLIGQTISDAGYDAEYSLKPKPLVRPPRWEDTIRYTKQRIHLEHPALLDFGAAGKGYLVDIVAEIMENAGVENYTINAGGDIRTRNVKGSALRIGLENPLDTSEVVGVALVSNQSLCASAGSRRAWDKYQHIIDPVTLESPKDIVATWVVAADTLTADGLATALYFAEPEALAGRFDFSYALLRRDMSLVRSRNFPADVYEAVV